MNKEKLLKVNLWMSKYLVFSIPFVIWIVTWAINLTSHGEEYVEPKTFLWEVLVGILLSGFFYLLILSSRLYFGESLEK